MNEFFHQLSKKCALWIGKPAVFFWSCIVIIIWALTGPYFSYSDTWQLIINTSTTIFTFLIGILLVSGQNRAEISQQLKQDEILRVLIKQGARKRLIDIEDASEKEIKELEEEFRCVRNCLDKDN